MQCKAKLIVSAVFPNSLPEKLNSQIASMTFTRPAREKYNQFGCHIAVLNKSARRNPGKAVTNVTIRAGRKVSRQSLA